jgi:hypothetical protein
MTGREIYIELLTRLSDIQLRDFETITILRIGAFPDRTWYREALSLIEAEIERRNPEGLHAA